MTDSARYSAIADQMLRLAASAITEFERNGYVELSRAWRRLAGEAAELERKAGPPIAAQIAPAPPETSPRD